MRLLVIEDKTTLNKNICEALLAENFAVERAFDGSFDILTVIISNSGKTLSEDEQKFLFTHFFRGKNAQNQQGFGLGLVLAQRIFAIHNTVIKYHAKENIKNSFSVEFPRDYQQIEMFV